MAVREDVATRFRDDHKISPPGIFPLDPRKPREACAIGFGTYGDRIMKKYIDLGRTNGMLGRTSSMLYFSNDNPEFMDMHNLFAAESIHDPYCKGNKEYESHLHTEAKLLPDRFNRHAGFGKDVNAAIESLGMISREMEPAINDMNATNVKNGLVSGTVYLTATSGGHLPVVEVGLYQASHVGILTPHSNSCVFCCLPVEDAAKENFKVGFARDLMNPLMKIIIITQNDKFASSHELRDKADGYAVEAGQDMVLAHAYDESQESMTDITTALTEKGLYKLVGVAGESFTHPLWETRKHWWQFWKRRHPYIDTDTAVPEVTQMVRTVFENPSLVTVDATPANSQQYVFINTPGKAIFDAVSSNIGDILGKYHARALFVRRADNQTHVIRVFRIAKCPSIDSLLGYEAQAGEGYTLDEGARQKLAAEAESMLSGVSNAAGIPINSLHPPKGDS